MAGGSFLKAKFREGIYMIHNFDRSGWVGASDTYSLVQLQRKTKENGVEVDTKSWADFKAVKLGIVVPERIKTLYMKAGDAYERLILDAYSEEDMEYDKILEIPEYALRVNLDGNTKDKIVEAKTYKQSSGKISSSLLLRYNMQIQTQLFAWRYLFGEPVTAELRSYSLTDDDYEAVENGYTLDIEPSRLHSEFVDYDEYFVKYKLLPKLEEFADFLNPVFRPEFVKNS